MSITIIPLRFCLLLSLTILNVLAQQILIDQLNSQESANDGETKLIITPSNSDQIQDVSLFGWIKINPLSTHGYIFDFCYGNCPYNSDPRNNGVLLFSLQFISLTDPTLMISFSKKGEDPKISSMSLSPTEINSWMFVYLGHSFIHSKQTYYKHSMNNQQRILVDEVTLTQDSKTEYQLITGINQFTQKKFFIGEIERLTVQLGDKAYKEKDFYLLHTLHPDRIDQINCSVFFSGCAFTGYSNNICSTASSSPIKNINSVLYRNKVQDFICLRGKKIIVKKNIEYITEENWLDLLNQEEITIQSFQNDECKE